MVRQRAGTTASPHQENYMNNVDNTETANSNRSDTNQHSTNSHATKGYNSYIENQTYYPTVKSEEDESLKRKKILCQ